MSFAAFLGAIMISFVAAMFPGPSFVVTVRTAAAEGFRAAAGLAIGLGIGTLVWCAAALFGLALLFEVAPLLLSLLKVAGGLFLFWIAVKTWRHAERPLAQPAAGAVPRGLGSAVRLGMVTQLANPKVAIFFGAVFVGLVPPGIPWPMMVLLALVISFNEGLWFALVGRVFSLGWARAAYAEAKIWIDRTFGTILAAFGVKVSTS